MKTSFGNLLSQSFPWFKLPELFLQEEMHVAGKKFWALRVFGPWIFSIVVTVMSIAGIQMLSAQMWNTMKGRN